MDNADYQRLLQIRTHCDDAKSCLERFGEDFDTFLNDRVYFNALAMSVLQIGEIAGNLSEDFRKETSNEMPWSMIKGMRNLLAHAYGEIDAEKLWATALNDLPTLKDFCDRYLGQDAVKTEAPKEAKTTRKTK